MALAFAGRLLAGHVSPLKALVLFAVMLGGGGPSPHPGSVVSARIVLNAGNPDAKRLYDDLLSNYNKLVRPVVNTTDILPVRIKLKLSQLIDVVSPQKKVTTTSLHFEFLQVLRSRT